MHWVLGVKPQFTANYHLNSNSQQHDLGVPTPIHLRYPKNWNFYADSFKYTYNKQDHAAPSSTPMNLVLSGVRLNLR